MRSHRLEINNYDLSTVVEVEPQSEVVGFTIVSAPSGPKTPVLINSLTELRNTFGKSSSAYPELYEVEQFVGNGYSCYVGNSNAGSVSKVPVIVVTNSGYYLAETDIKDSEIHYVDNKLELTPGKIFRYIPCKVTTDNKLRLDFTGIAGSYYQSISPSKLVRYSIFNNTLNTEKTNTSLVTVPSSNTYLESSEISGLFTAADLTDTFISNNSIYLNVTSIPDEDTIISYIMPKYPSSFSCEKIVIASSAEAKIDDATNVDKRNVVSITATKYYNQQIFTVCNSLLGSFTYNSAVSKFDEVSNDFINQKGINIISCKNQTFGTDTIYSSDFPIATIITGSSNLAVSSEDKDWSDADDSMYDDVDLFFDPTFHLSSDSNTSSFFSLHTNHSLAGCIFNKTWNTKDALSPLTYGSNYWNICGKVRVNIGTEYIDSSCVGAYAVIVANGLRDYNGGIAPMFTTGILGTMSVSATNVSYRYTKEDLKKLDKVNYNPIVFDTTYGLMITSQKTCKGGALTDWSYIGHVAAFLNFEKEVYNQVMIPQIGKPNNPYYRELRKQQVEHLLEERLVTNRIWAEGIVDTSTAEGVNDDMARKARKFVIVVKVKVDIFSEYVTLNFYNVDQSTSLSVSQ